MSAKTNISFRCLSFVPKPGTVAAKGLNGSFVVASEVKNLPEI